ncbi:hypothetical protein [Prevotella nigrescens]|uniref:hypothetical protein n=1 Tax=Prevotella nigrescens TaxID=28133 RepID=UPI0002AE8C4F|nr:hypothetical protein [Prevotella nigrescens]ELX66703.1 hypothetical protein HMPREF0662_02017 [Prevotella nigrescens F0103]QUB54576.1 hypothetical protein J4865_04195 [Prevotella nigrescens F0103]
MKKMQLNREAYLKPEVEVIGVNVENLLTTASGDHEHIGQGNTIETAKQGEFDEEQLGN